MIFQLCLVNVAALLVQGHEKGDTDISCQNNADCYKTREPMDAYEGKKQDQIHFVDGCACNDNVCSLHVTDAASFHEQQYPKNCIWCGDMCQQTVEFYALVNRKSKRRPPTEPDTDRKYGEQPISCETHVDCYKTRESLAINEKNRDDQAHFEIDGCQCRNNVCKLRVTHVNPSDNDPVNEVCVWCGDKCGSPNEFYDLLKDGARKKRDAEAEPIGSESESEGSGEEEAKPVEKRDVSSSSSSSSEEPQSARRQKRHHGNPNAHGASATTHKDDKRAKRSAMAKTLERIRRGLFGCSSSSSASAEACRKAEEEAKANEEQTESRRKRHEHDDHDHSSHVSHEDAETEPAKRVKRGLFGGCSSSSSASAEACRKAEEEAKANEGQTERRRKRHEHDDHDHSSHVSSSQQDEDPESEQPAKRSIMPEANPVERVKRFLFGGCSSSSSSSAQECREEERRKKAEKEAQNQNNN